MTISDSSRNRGTTRRQLLTSAASGVALAAVARDGVAAALAQDASPVATPVTATEAVLTASGPVTGVVLDGVASYKGIPYTVPLTDALRWTPPQPPISWTEPLAATDS